MKKIVKLADKVKGATYITVAISLLKGAAKQYVWGLIRGLQLTVYLIFIRVRLSAVGQKYMQLYMNFAQADVFLAGDNIYEIYFKFSIQEALNDTFAAYGVDDMNFLP